MSNLFRGSAAGAALPPLAVRMRPRTVDEVLGQEHLLRAGSPLRRLLAPQKDGPVGPSSVILWGPPGTGKTTFAQLLARSSQRSYVELSAVTAGVKDVRRVMDEALTARDLHGRTTVLFLDEIHRFSKAQQDALLPGVEQRWVVLVAATTENPSFSVVAPLLSRSLLLTLEPLKVHHVRALLERALEDERGFAGRLRAADDALAHIVRVAGADARRALTVLEAAAGVALERGEYEGPEGAQPVRLELVDAEQAVDVAAVRYDRAADQHYDVVSALVKSIRGSDVDAALHYAARMLEAGEDPRFLARRLIIAASEDIGMADPTALPAAVAAAQAVALIGMPEGRIVLAQAVVHLATAPKSNAVYRAIDAAIGDIRAGKSGSVPAHLRDSHYPGADRVGHGQGYRYTHESSHGVLAQQYPPDELVGRDYYHPSARGAEKVLRERTARLRQLVRGAEQASPSPSAGGGSE